MTLMVTMVTIAISSALIGLFLRTLLPKYRSAHQGASWREALQGAEAGVNHGINELNELAGKQGNTSSYPWAEKGWSLADAAFSLNGERLLNEALLPLLGGSSGVSVSKLTMDVYTRQARRITPGFESARPDAQSCRTATRAMIDATHACGG
jgi:hypothetical protein